MELHHTPKDSDQVVKLIYLHSLKPNAPIPKSVSGRLAWAIPKIDLPALEWIATVNGNSLRILLIFQIHPFIVEPRKKLAYFPITVGLHIAPGGTQSVKKLLKLLEAPWVNPKNWSDADRNAFWEHLFESLRDIAKGFAPTRPEVAEAIVTLSAQIKVASGNQAKTATQPAIDKVLNTLGKAGQVIQWNCETRPVVKTAKKLIWSRLSDEGFERLIFNLVSSTQGYENPAWLTHTNTPDKGRDIEVKKITHDLLSGSRSLRVIVQCKHKKGVGIKEVVHLKEQMTLLEPPRVDELILATSGRFSTEAIEWIERHNQSNSALQLTMWPDSHLERLLAERPHLVSEFNL